LFSGGGFHKEYRPSFLLCPESSGDGGDGERPYRLSRGLDAIRGADGIGFGHGGDSPKHEGHDRGEDVRREDEQLTNGIFRTRQKP